MIKVKLELRIKRFLNNYSAARYIPLHPDDYNLLKSEGRLNDFPLPLFKLKPSGGGKKPV